MNDVASSGTSDTAAHIRAAVPGDAGAVRLLLTDAALPLDGVPDDLAHFLVAEHDGAVVAAIGLERYDTVALLRSAVVSPAARGRGLGERLVLALLASARASAVQELVLLTTTAEHWFPRFGFERIERSTAPSVLQASEEFRGACPASAVVMRLHLQT